MRDKELKLEDDEASHTLGGAGKGVPKEREVNRIVMLVFFFCLIPWRVVD